MTDHPAETDARDAEIGEAIRRFDPPEHAAGFWATAEAQLTRLPRSPRWPRRAWVLRTGLAAAAVAAVVAVVFFGLPGLHEAGPQPSLAAQVLVKMTSALGGVRTFEADEISTDYENDSAGVTSTSHITLAASGDGRVDVNHGKWISIFNSALGTQWTLERKHGRLVVDSTIINLPAGSVWTNIGDSSNYLMQRSYSTALRALLAAHQRGIDVRSSTYDGRPAWAVKLAYDPAEGVVIRLTIDQQTGLVFASGQYKNGQPEWESHIENVRINQPLARSLFRLPAGLHLDLRQAIPSKSDYGYKRVPLSRVESLVGYAPLVPARVPDGYVLADVTALPKSEKTAIGGMRALVSMVYRRGLSSFTVALMPDKDGNPFADPEGGAVTAGDLSQHVTLVGGELNGSRADIFIGLWAQTAQIFVWCEGVPLNVMIRGDLTRDELVAVAESLHAYSGDQ